MAWSRRLIPPLVLKDGRELKTLSDAREMILGLLERQRRASAAHEGALPGRIYVGAGVLFFLAAQIGVQGLSIVGWYLLWEVFIAPLLGIGKR
jgi:hypothetical protein